MRIDKMTDLYEKSLVKLELGSVLEMLAAVSYTHLTLPTKA